MHEPGAIAVVVTIMMSLCLPDAVTSQLTSESSLFQCQPSQSQQSGQVYIPNIPDFYFDHVNAAAFRTATDANLTTLGGRTGTTFVFTIPPELRSCSGTVVAMQYCYQARNGDIDDAFPIFRFLSLHRDGSQFVVNRSINVMTTPQESICLDPTGDIQRICCSTSTLATNQQFQILSSNFSFGVVALQGSNRRLLAFNNSATEYRYEQFRVRPFGNNGPSLASDRNTFRVDNPLSDRSILLLRFLIDPVEVITTPTVLTTLPTDAATTEQRTTTTVATVATTEQRTTTTEATVATTAQSTTTTEATVATTEQRTTTMEATVATTEQSTTTMEATVATTEQRTTTTEATVATTAQSTTTMEATVATTEQSTTTTEATVATTEQRTTTMEVTVATTEQRTTTAEATVATTEQSITTAATTENQRTMQSSSGQTNTLATTSNAATERNGTNDRTTARVTDSSTLSSSSGVNSGLIGGIVVGVLAACVLLLVGVSLIVFFSKRKKEKYHVNGNALALTNAIYDSAACNGADQDYNLYAGIGPQSGMDSQELYSEVEPAYAETGAVSLNVSHSYAVLTSDQSTQQRGTMHSTCAAAMEEENIYQVPPTDMNDLHSHLRANNIPRNSIGLSDHLGSGEFGVVHKGVWLSPDGEVEVAVKTLKEGSGEENRVKFLQEAAIMAQFKHPNVVTMYGVVTQGEPVLIILDLLSKGDLRDHLWNLRSSEGTTSTVDEHTLLSYCRQVASGMAYLSSKAFVHRDLAARNILVSADEICKIADFGMSRDLMDESYYVSHGGQIPVKWTAPEALHYKKYSTASDVWSYGALMYEIWSVGHKPFENLSNPQAIQMVDTGYRLPPPPGCPRALYTIMMSCWHKESSGRPSFLNITKQLSLPDTKLLEWSEEDKSVHPEAAQLGADLLCGEELYKDLQIKYCAQTDYDTVT